MLHLETMALCAIPVIGVCVAAGIRSRVRAAKEARLGSFRSFRATIDTYRRQQNEFMQQAMREARNAR